MGEATTSDRRGAPLLLTGWGRTAPSAAHVIAPGSVTEAAIALGQAGGRGLIARGLGGRSGDAAQNAGGSVLLATGLDRLLDVDLARPCVSAEAGVSLDRLMRALLPL